MDAPERTFNVLTGSPVPPDISETLPLLPVIGDKRLTLVVGRGYRMREKFRELEDNPARRLKTKMCNLQPSPWKLFVDPDRVMEEAHIVANFEKETTFQAIEEWLRRWKDPQSPADEPGPGDIVSRKFDRIVFERVPNNQYYGIPWTADLIHKTFNRLLREEGSLEWYGLHDQYNGDDLYWPSNIALDPEKFVLPIKRKNGDFRPMALWKKANIDELPHDIQLLIPQFHDNVGKKDWIPTLKRVSMPSMGNGD